MKNIIKTLREYMIPILILAVFPLLDLLLSIESKLYGKITVDTIVMDVSSTMGDSLNDEMVFDESEIMLSKDKIDPRIVNKFREGELLFQNNEFSKALDVWGQLINTGIQKHFLYNNIGVIYSKQNDYEKADSIFNLAINEDSLYVNAYYNLARVSSRQKRNLKAINCYKKALVINPRMSGAWFNLSLLYIREKEYERANDCIVKAHEMGFDKGRVAYTLGTIELKMSDTISAINSFNKAIKYNPASIKARYQKALLLLEQGKESEALMNIKKIEKINSKFYQGNLALIKYKLMKKDYLGATKILSVLKQKFPNNIDVLYEEAKLSGIQGRDKEALKIYHKIAKLDHENPRVYYNIAVNMMDVGNVLEGEKAYKKALSLDPFHWQSAYNLGVYYLKNDQFKMAEALLLKSSNINGTHIPSKYNLALVYQKIKMRDKAEILFSEVLKMDSLHTNSLYNLALIKMGRRKFEEAEKLFTEVLDIESKHSKSYFNLGLIAKKKNDLRKALKFFKKAVDVSNGYAKANYNIALIYLSDATIKDAKRALDNAISDDPKYLRAYLKKVDLLIEESKIDAAIKLLELAERNATKTSKDLLSISDKYSEIGKLDKSNSILIKVLKSNEEDYKIVSKIVNNFVSLKQPENAIRYLEKIPIEKRFSKTLKLAAKLYEETGNTDKAINNYKNYLLKNPTDKKVRSALAELYERKKHYGSAAKEYKKLFKMNKKNYDLATKTAYLFLKGENYKSSIKYYRIAHKLNTKKKSPQYYVALLLSRQNMIDSAMVAWNEFIQKYPDDGRGFYQLGKIASQKKDYSKAKNLLSKAVELNEVNASYYLAETLYHQNEFKEAKFELNKYLSINRTSKKAKKLLKQINKKI